MVNSSSVFVVTDLWFSFAWQSKATKESHRRFLLLLLIHSSTLGSPTQSFQSLQLFELNLINLYLIVLLNPLAKKQFLAPFYFFVHVEFSKIINLNV